MLPGIANQLRRLVKAHGLAVDQGRAKGVGPAPLHPGRGIDQQGEADGVALGKSIGAETLDLMEAILDELLVIALGPHAGDELLFVFPDIAVVAEGRHGPA